MQHRGVHVDNMVYIAVMRAYRMQRSSFGNTELHDFPNDCMDKVGIVTLLVNHPHIVLVQSPDVPIAQTYIQCKLSRSQVDLAFLNRKFESALEPVSAISVDLSARGRQLRQRADKFGKLLARRPDNLTGR